MCTPHPHSVEWSYVCEAKQIKVTHEVIYVNSVFIQRLVSISVHVNRFLIVSYEIWYIKLLIQHDTTEESYFVNFYMRARVNFSNHSLLSIDDCLTHRNHLSCSVFATLIDDFTRKELSVRYLFAAFVFVAYFSSLKEKKMKCRFQPQRAWTHFLENETRDQLRTEQNVTVINTRMY